MRLTIRMDGREAVPVRAIPYVTNWSISPDMLVSAFSGGSEFRPAISAIQTFRNNDGAVSQIQSSGWERIKVQIDALDQRFPHDAAGRAAWEEESINLLPQGICVWLDEFVSAFSNDFSPASRIPDDRGEFPYLDFSPLLPNGVEEIVFKGFVRSSNHTAEISYIDAETSMKILRTRIKGIFAKEFELFVESGFLRAIDSDGGILFDEREISEFVPRKRFFAFEDLVSRWEDRAGRRQVAINLISEQLERKRLSLYGGKTTRRPAKEDAFFSFGEIVLAESNMFEIGSSVEISDECCRVLASEIDGEQNISSEDLASNDPVAHVVQNKGGEREVLRCKALVCEFEAIWPSIRCDLKDKTRHSNTLLNEANFKHSYYDVEMALNRLLKNPGYTMPMR